MSDMQSAGWVDKGSQNWQAFNSTGGAYTFDKGSWDLVNFTANPWYGNVALSSNELRTWDWSCPFGVSPSVAVWPSGQQDIFWQGGNGNLWAGSWNNGSMHGPFQIGGGSFNNLATAPSAGYNGALGQENVYWTGIDGNLWEAYETTSNNSWSGPNNFHMGPLGSSPSVAIWTSSGQQDIFWRGTDNNLWAGSWNNGSMHGPFKIGGGSFNNLASAPSAVYNAARGEDDVYWRGTDGNLWEAYENTGTNTWYGPTKWGMGPLNSGPSVAVWTSGQQDIFWRGTDGNLWAGSWNNGMNGPFKIGGGNFNNLGSAPSAGFNSALGQENVYWKGTDLNLYGVYEITAQNQWSTLNNYGMGPLG